MQAGLALGNEEMIRTMNDIGFGTLGHHVKLADKKTADSCELVELAVVAVAVLVLVTVLCIQRLLFPDIVGVAFVSESRIFVVREFEERLLDRCVGLVEMILVDNCGCIVENVAAVVNRFRIHCLFA